ncbi:unnamed protein product [Symbiodinium natans]|uniref:Uncharacterized protein n=1 Tax=Symbiodinium natans TaxID=878477 RepID=A0A812QFJ9_9DINO|nr:unnamed protein product [Symbiodinium natans]
MEGKGAQKAQNWQKSSAKLYGFVVEAVRVRASELSLLLSRCLRLEKVIGGLVAAQRSRTLATNVKKTARRCDQKDSANLPYLKFTLQEALTGHSTSVRRFEGFSDLLTYCSQDSSKYPSAAQAHRSSTGSDPANRTFTCGLRHGFETVLASSQMLKSQRFVLKP